MSDGPPQGRKKRRLTNILLNRKFQLKYTGMIVGLSSVISVGLGFFLLEQMRENSRMLQLEAELDAVFQEQLAQSDAQAFLVMIGALLLFNILLALSAIFVTHRMAGPIFVIRRYVRMLGEGKIPRVRSLRKGDEFIEVIEQVQLTVDQIEMRTRGEIGVLKNALSAMEGSVPESTISDIRELIEQKRSSLPQD